MNTKDKLTTAKDLITEVIMENKDNWDKQYIWLSKLLHAQGALKDSISEISNEVWRIKKPFVGEKE